MDEKKMTEGELQGSEARAAQAKLPPGWMVYTVGRVDGKPYRWLAEHPASGSRAVAKSEEELIEFMSRLHGELKDEKIL